MDAAATLGINGSHSINCPASRSDQLTKGPNTAAYPSTATRLTPTLRLSGVRSDTHAAIVKYDNGSTGSDCVSIFFTRKMHRLSSGAGQ